ncbi:unnamed protein product [Cunninghamella blakesleeana]
MGVRVFFLTLLRFLLFLLSAATLGCHAAQVALIGDHKWFPSHYTYILYFVGPGVSTISALALLFVSISSVKAIRGDRVCGILNSALMIAVVIVCTLKSEQVLYGQSEQTYKIGYQGYCSDFSNQNLSNRCWLTNGTWIGSIVIAVIWILLSFYVFIQQRSDIYNEEYEVYDFKSDIPMAITSNSPIIHHQQQKQTPSPIVPPHAATPLNNNSNMNQDVYYDPQPTPNYFDYGYQYHQQQTQYHQQQQQQAVLDSTMNNNNYYYDPHHQQQPYHQDPTYSPTPFKNNDDTTHILQDTSVSANSSHASYTQSPHTPAATITDSKIKQVPHAY